MNKWMKERDERRKLYKTRKISYVAAAFWNAFDIFPVDSSSHFQ